MTTSAKFKVGVDTGGTFTDLIVLSDDGRILRKKILSTPDDFSRGILSAVGEVLDEFGLAGADVESFIHGTTVATNAILEASGPQVGLLTTTGFADVLEIGRGRWGGDVHDLKWVKPEPLVPRRLRLELDERISARGEILEPLDRQQAKRQLQQLRAAGVRDVAVCLLNSYANAEHEQAIRALAASEFPDLNVCVSNDVLGEAREFERTSTTVINAYLVPVVDRYLDRLQRALASRSATRAKFGSCSRTAASSRPS